VQSFFEPTDFLRTLRDWILFYVEDGETRKTVLRQHQRRAVERIVARCAETQKQRGPIWHTQGSGKTFTLLTAARLILEQKVRFQKPTVVVVVDRLELEGQLKGWVERLLGEMQQQEIAVWRAESKGQLRDLLKADRRGLILSMIHKFEGIEKDASARDNIFVFIDEAHRSVAGDLGTYLMAAVPRATILGFTGTPIAKTEEGKGTFKIFGKEDEQGYLDKYTIAESIEDETTLPIRHTLAASRLLVPHERLDHEFFELANDEAVTDITELNRVLDRAVTLRAFLTADDRVQQVAAFVAEHFRNNVNPLGFKAFLVGVNREACAKYKKALDKLLPPEWIVPVYSPKGDDVVESPLVADLQITPQREEQTRLMFQKADENPRILIVTDKLLTGFDAPLLYCLYLDKPMRDHVLLQAIARVNRPHVDDEGNRKRVGLVVDFVGVLQEMEKALRFDSADVSGVIEDLDLLLADLLEKLAKAEAAFLVEAEGGSADERLERVIYGRFRDSEIRGEFYERFREIEALWEILSPAPELRDHLPIYRRLAGLYQAVRNAYSSQPDYTAEFARKTRELVQSSVVQEPLGRYARTVTFDAETLAELRKEETSDEGKVFNLVRGLRKEVEETPDLEPVLLPLKERAERIQKDLEERKVTALAALDQLEVLAREKTEALKEAQRIGLPPLAFAIYWQFRSDRALAAAGLVPVDLARRAEELARGVPAAATNAEEHRRLRASLYGPVIKLEPADRLRVVARILELLLPTDRDDRS
ncbi:MAG: HsdR family type I site-specific deoxyribonuclease, partial [Rhodospirillaceae bacterium]|nr:HsdR family type I site-specific deoxyribonuclease [Rhodospirillaceae bacterium]